LRLGVDERRRKLADRLDLEDLAERWRKPMRQILLARNETALDANQSNAHVALLAWEERPASRTVRPSSMHVERRR
jgi:hypothetical protein